MHKGAFYIDEDKTKINHSWTASVRFIGGLFQFAYHYLGSWDPDFTRVASKQHWRQDFRLL
uniref:Uncharacterized protein n=1 Tax=Loigolactobacillus rennini TaxID=238013 RepID=A0A1K2I7B6_9LACO|nr:hypothetical protein LREN565_1342 [Loigolactobacillus rennini]